MPRSTQTPRTACTLVMGGGGDDGIRSRLRVFEAPGEEVGSALAAEVQHPDVVRRRRDTAACRGRERREVIGRQA